MKSTKYVHWFPLAALVAWTSSSTANAEGPSPNPQPTVPDLCAELDLFGHPSRCEPVGPGMAAYWDAKVCCDDLTCYEPGEGGCAPELDVYWCGAAELHGDNTLTCVYEIPTFCQVYPCGGGPTTVAAPPYEHALCCYEVGCYDAEGGLCGGELLWCGSGVTNEDGTVTCLDDD